MSILSGYKKVKDRILTSSGYQLLSRWTSSNTVDFDDGKTAQTKVGAINGIIKDKNSLSTVTDDSFAAGAVAVKDAYTELNSKLIAPDYKSAVAIQSNYTCMTNGYVIGTIQGAVNGWASIRSSKNANYFLALCTSSENPIAVCIPFASGDSVIFGSSGTYNLAFAPAK